MEWREALKEKGVSAFEDGSINIGEDSGAPPSSLLRDLSCITSAANFELLLRYMLSAKTKDDQRLALGRKLASFSASLATDDQHLVSDTMLLSAALSVFYQKEPPKAVASKLSLLEAGNIQRATLLLNTAPSMVPFIISFLSYMLARKRCMAKQTPCYAALLDAFRAAAKQPGHQLFEFVAAQVQLPLNKFTHSFVATWLKQLQDEQACRFIGHIVSIASTNPSVHVLQFLLQVRSLHTQYFVGASRVLPQACKSVPIIVSVFLEDLVRLLESSPRPTAGCRSALVRIVVEAQRSITIDIHPALLELIAALAFNDAGDPQVLHRCIKKTAISSHASCLSRRERSCNCDKGTG
jgi:hypothetical protein